MRQLRNQVGTNYRNFPGDLDFARSFVRDAAHVATWDMALVMTAELCATRGGKRLPGNETRKKHRLYVRNAARTSCRVPRTHATLHGHALAGASAGAVHWLRRHASFGVDAFARAAGSVWKRFTTRRRSRPAVQRRSGPARLLNTNIDAYLLQEGRAEPRCNLYDGSPARRRGCAARAARPWRFKQ